MAVLMPVLPTFLAAHPQVRVEIIADDNLTDIVASRFDAGIRFGSIVEKDMIAVRVAPDMRRSVVASPAYFAENPPPRTPHDLARHRCIAYRMVRSGGIFAWEFFDKKGQPLTVRVEGPLVFNDGDLMREAALRGIGIAYVYEDEARAGRLARDGRGGEIQTAIDPTKVARLVLPAKLWTAIQAATGWSMVVTRGSTGDDREQPRSDLCTGSMSPLPLGRLIAQARRPIPTPRAIPRPRRAPRRPPSAGAPLRWAFRGGGRRRPRSWRAGVRAAHWR